MSPLGLRHAPGRELQRKCLHRPGLAAQEARRDQQQLTGQLALAAGLRREPTLGVALHVGDDYAADGARIVRQHALHAGLEDSRIAALLLGGLQLAVVGAQRARPLGPGVVLQALHRCGGHQFQLGDRCAALAQAGAHAVVASVAAAHDDDILALGGDLRLPAVHQRLRGLGEVIHREVHALRVLAGCTQSPGPPRAAAEHHRVVARDGLRVRLGVQEEGHALRLHQADSARYDLLGQLHVRDAVL